MDSQFRCGKCGKPISSKFTKCIDCGSLGPHTFNSPAAGTTETGRGPQSPQRRDAPPPDRGERQAPPARNERYYEPADIPNEPPLRSGGRQGDDDSRFPAGMRHRSPILDHIEDMDSGEKKEPKKRQRRERERDEDNGPEEKPAAKKRYKDFLEEDEDEERQPAPINTRGLVTTAISIILVVVLLMGFFYIYNNFDEMTRWLASPTVPEAVRPEGGSSSGSNPISSSGNSTQPSQPAVNPLAWLSNIFAPDKPGQKPTANTTVPTAPASQDPVPPVIEPVTPATPSTPSDTTKPTVYDPVIIKSISDRGATITWKTSEPCISEVHYKTDTGETRIIKVSTKPESNHAVALTGLDSGQKYYIKIRCQDNGGNINDPVERSFQTLLSSADTTEPQLAGEPTRTVDDTTATIAWRTDEKAKSLVKYGMVTGDEFSSSVTYEYSTSHSVFISGLSPSTTYRYQIISTDASGNTMTKTSADYVFKTEQETGASPYMGSRAPNFTLKNLKGETVSLSQFRGKKVILNFWASWCSPCKLELPHFQSVWDKYSSGNEVVILTVAGSQSEEAEIRSFITNGNYTLLVCLDPGEEAFNKYELTSIPRTYFIDKEGFIRRIQQGMITGVGELEFMISSY